MTRVLVFGTGAVGGYYGACLQRAGCSVVFVARGDNQRVLRSEGLRVTGAMGEISLDRVDAVEVASGDFDLILFCVKNYDLQTGAEAIAGCGGLVMTMQNGVEAPYRMRELIGDRVLAGSTGIVADLSEPAHVDVTSSYAWIRFGEPDGTGLSDRVKGAEAILAVEGIEPRAEADVRVALWEKMALMCGMAGLTTLHQRPMGEILTDPSLRSDFECIVRECESVARARGVVLPADFFDDRLTYASRIEPESMSSMSRDFVRGRRIELDTFNGALVRMAREAAIEVPRNEAVNEQLSAATSDRQGRIS